MTERATTRPRMLPIIVGNLFEWFDFTIYGFFAATIAHQFFPPGDEGAAMLAVAATFGAAIVMRPIGAVALADSRRAERVCGNVRPDASGRRGHRPRRIDNGAFLLPWVRIG